MVEGAEGMEAKTETAAESCGAGRDLPSARGEAC